MPEFSGEPMACPGLYRGSFTKKHEWKISENVRCCLPENTKEEKKMT
jgi:hypothetical protein